MKNFVKNIKNSFMGIEMLGILLSVVGMAAILGVIVTLILVIASLPFMLFGAIIIAFANLLPFLEIELGVFNTLFAGIILSVIIQIIILIKEDIHETH